MKSREKKLQVGMCWSCGSRVIGKPGTVIVWPKTRRDRPCCSVRCAQAAESDKAKPLSLALDGDSPKPV